ncbi:LysR family transcriptional regulator [Streptomyces sp. Tu 2975]|uniref:LysR family transcriptional regulator n=1 Tax=Streptomyces sp. Tu 2975 TaxID=2676871 RepID=UPI001357DE7A|nr:LysR family transcriptional regulator [Streptomyces sp. Tu 2975]QIP88083.1 LysR family transcriptional regulator [Streptomyces sp. Tu 2975]
MLDIRRLHMLKTVATRGSIAAAAQSLALSAGAVSQQLSALRHDVGVDLLRPDGRTVALTEAGQVLLEHAGRILAAVEEAECAIAAVKGTVGVTATLAALPSTVARIVAPALTELGSRHPQLTVTCLVTDQAQLRELTLGTVDVVLGQRYHHLTDVTPRGIEVSPLLDDPLLVVTAAGQGDERPVALRELATHPLAVPPPTTDCGQAVLQACRQAGFTPTPRYVTADIAAQLTLARAGLATALVPGRPSTRPHPASARRPSGTTRSFASCSPRPVTPGPRTRRPRPSPLRCAQPRSRTAPSTSRRPDDCAVPRCLRAGSRARPGSAGRVGEGASVPCPCGDDLGVG